MPRQDPRLQTIPDNFNERIQDRTIRHMLYLEGLKTRQAKEIDRFIVEEIIPDLQDQLAIRLARIERLGYDMGAVTTARIETQIASLENISQRFNRDLRVMIQGELFDLAKDEIAWQVGVIKSESGIDIDMVIPTAEQLERAVFATPFEGKNFQEWFKNLEDSAKEKITSEIRRGVVEGRTIQQHTRAIIGTKSSGYTDGVIQTTRRNAETITRTAVAHVQASAKEQLFKNNQDLIKGMKWVATLDTRTSPICRSRDGRVYPADNYPKVPAHPNCRSSITPVLKSYKELGFDVDELPDGMRSSMNGSVPKDITYNQWLKKQPIEIQEQALGVKRAKLFREGGLDIQKFTNANDQQLTLKEIRRREADAFEKAGVTI